MTQFTDQDEPNTNAGHEFYEKVLEIDGADMKLNEFETRFIASYVDEPTLADRASDRQEDILDRIWQRAG